MYLLLIMTFGPLGQPQGHISTYHRTKGQSALSLRHERTPNTSLPKLRTRTELRWHGVHYRSRNSGLMALQRAQAFPWGLPQGTGAA